MMGLHQQLLVLQFMPQHHDAWMTAVHELLAHTHAGY
jgi:hypothetical protein